MSGQPTNHDHLSKKKSSAGNARRNNRRTLVLKPKWVRIIMAGGHLPPTPPNLWGLGVKPAKIA
jgi:hypothetical protein